MSKNTINKNKIIKKNKEGLQKGGDGYVINPSINIAGMPGHTRYSYNLIPVFSGELLEDGNGYNSDPTMQNIECPDSETQNGGGIKNNKNKQNCGCNGIAKNKKDKSVFDLIKLQGGNPEIANISQFGAIQSVSKILQPLGINNLLSLVTLIFLFHLSIKKPKKSIQAGGYVKELEKILAPLGKHNLLVLASLLLLHHFAYLSENERKKPTKKDIKTEISKKRKSTLLFGGSELTTSITPMLSKLLAPLGVNTLGTSVVLIMLYDAFVGEKDKKKEKDYKNDKIKKGGNPLKNLIAPLGINSFIATGILIILGKIFLNKVIEVDKNIIDEKKKMKGGSISKKNYEKLVNILSPISFNSFATESFLKKISK
jgi:hypothetical protein